MKRDFLVNIVPLIKPKTITTTGMKSQKRLPVQYAEQCPIKPNIISNIEKRLIGNLFSSSFNADLQSKH
jgi:hypothetical protein